MQIVGLSPDKACMERSQHCASVLRISSSSADSDRNIISKIFRPSHVLTDQNIVSKISKQSRAFTKPHERGILKRSFYLGASVSHYEIKFCTWFIWNS